MEVCTGKCLQLRVLKYITKMLSAFVGCPIDPLSMNNAQYLQRGHLYSSLSLIKQYLQKKHSQT